MTMNSGRMMPIDSHARDTGRSLRRIARSSKATTATKTRMLDRQTHQHPRVRQRPDRYHVIDEDQERTHREGCQQDFRKPHAVDVRWSTGAHGGMLVRRSSSVGANPADRPRTAPNRTHRSPLYREAASSHGSWANRIHSSHIGNVHTNTSSAAVATTFQTAAVRAAWVIGRTSELPVADPSLRGFMLRRWVFLATTRASRRQRS